MVANLDISIAAKDRYERINVTISEMGVVVHQKNIPGPIFPGEVIVQNVLLPSGNYDINVEAICNNGMVVRVNRNHDHCIGQNYIKGDVNQDGLVNIADAIFLLNHLFGQGSVPSCFKAADINRDCMVNIADAIFLLNFLFTQGPRPNPPFPDCGPDSLPCLGLTCDSFLPCP